MELSPSGSRAAAGGLGGAGGGGAGGLRGGGDEGGGRVISVGGGEAVAIVRIVGGGGDVGGRPVALQLAEGEVVGEDRAAAALAAAIKKRVLYPEKSKSIRNTSSRSTFLSWR